ncbi:MAG: helix-turn-helix domain-containing protein [Clostridia bacterium]|nr:helix-turn-helix domain-containing protein [Clostridia bacterium]
MKKDPLLPPEVRSIATTCFVGKSHHKNRALHRHTGIELFYVVKGEAIHVTKRRGESEKQTPLRAGNYLLIDLDTTHGFLNGSPDFSLINLLFLPSLIDPDLPEGTTFEETIRHPSIGFELALLKDAPCNRVFDDEDRQILTTFEKAYKAFSKSATGYLQQIRCYCIEILIASMQQLLINVPSPTNNSTIAAICDYVDEHYAESITLTQICKEQYFSLPYISKKFKKTCGISFEQYLQQVRVQHACSLLLGTGLSIDAVANHVNYADTASFRKAFKRQTGKSPSAFRKSYTR